MAEPLHSRWSKATAIVLLGAGGVGKTSTSAALGIAAAQSGRRVVVLTVDPARRLVETLGLGSTYPSEVVEVPGVGAQRGGTLHATMLDPGHTLAALVDEFAPTPARAAAIHRNRLFQSLTTSLSGLSEYMAAERFRQLLHDPRFDMVIVDTPPAQNGVDVLDAPERMTTLLDHRIYRTLLAPRRGLLRTINAATQLAARAIGKVVGASLLSDVIEFFALFEGMDQGFGTRAAEVDDLLASSRTRFALVSTARPEALRTATWLSDQLRDRSIVPDALIINRRVEPVPAASASMHSAIRTAIADHNSAANSELDVLKTSPLVQGYRTTSIPDTPEEDPLEALKEMAAFL